MALVLAIIGFILVAGAVVGLNMGAGFYYLGCQGKIGGNNHTIEGKWVYDNSRCTIYTTETTCTLTSYKNIIRENENVTVCLWMPDESETTPDCYFNGELTCDDFTQSTVPKCQDVPDCQPVSAIKAAIDRLKPSI